MKQIVKTFEELEELLHQLAVDGNIADVVKLEDLTFEVQWVKSKMYVALDGKEYPDEVWITEDNRMLLIQELSEDHAKNIIRMIIRQDKEVAEQVKELTAKMTEAFANGGLDALLDLPTNTDEKDKPAAGSYLH